MSSSPAAGRQRTRNWTWAGIGASPRPAAVVSVHPQPPGTPDWRALAGIRGKRSRMLAVDWRRVAVLSGSNASMPPIGRRSVLPRTALPPSRLEYLARLQGVGHPLVWLAARQPPRPSSNRQGIGRDWSPDPAVLRPIASVEVRTHRPRAMGRVHSQRSRPLNEPFNAGLNMWQTSSWSVTHSARPYCAR
jgi:hypothetical protein